jgi:hypothetical protein
MSPYNRPQSVQMWSTGTALLILDRGARNGRVISTKLRPLYPPERPAPHCIGDCVSPRAGLDVCERSLPHRDYKHK